MLATKLATAALLSCPLLLGSFGSAWSSAARRSQPADQLALQQLQSNFHAASTYADYGLMLSLWDENAVFMGGGNVITGRQAIVDFFAAGPGWGTTANLTPSYKLAFDIHGNRATGHFECVIVSVPGSNPATTPLSTIPFGAQNPGVQIVQHSSASITAVKVGGKWLIETFTGSAGPLP